MLAKINEIIERNNLTEDHLLNPTIVARIALAAFGCQVQTLSYPTLGFYKDGELVAKAKMPSPENNPWFGIGFKYQSPRVANIAGFFIDFEQGILKANRHEAGLAQGGEWVLGFDVEVSFDEIKIERPCGQFGKIEIYA